MCTENNKDDKGITFTFTLLLIDSAYPVSEIAKPEVKSWESVLDVTKVGKTKQSFAAYLCCYGQTMLLHSGRSSQSKSCFTFGLQIVENSSLTEPLSAWHHDFFSLSC